MVTLCAVIFVSPAADAEDWPAYRRDAIRSAVTSERLTFPLSLQWRYRSAQPPKPAWPEPGRVQNTLDFDYAFQPVVAGGIVYFGSSGDDAVRAVDAASGRLLWSFVAGAPIRFAPQIAAGKLYLASDDGCVYCLDTKTGKELWWFRGGLDEGHLLAQGRLASRWPARSGVLVRNGIVYATMGMWPSEGVFLYALDAETGRQHWCNDTGYTDYIAYPHAPSVAFGGPAPQGYLLAYQDVLIVPTGRSAPAGYDIKTGRLLYYNSGEANRGGSHVVIGDDRLFAATVAWQPDQSVRLGESPSHRADSLAAINIATGREEWPYTRSIKQATDEIQGSRWRSEISAGIYGRQRAIFSGRRLYAMGNGKVDALDLNDTTAKQVWSVNQPRVYSEALTANALMLGLAGAIVALDLESGKPLWNVTVNGQVRGLAVSDGRVVASNELGEVFCFAAPVSREFLAVTETPNVSDNAAADRSVAELLKDVPEITQRRGYALVVGEPDARFAQALAERSQLHVVAILEDRVKVQGERQRLLSTTALYGARLSVLTIDLTKNQHRLPLPPYFANLVVVSGDVTKISGDELYRVLRPCGGMMAFVNGASVEESLIGVSLPQAEVQSGLVVRGKLPGAFDWDSKNEVDERVRWPLEFQWFGEPGPQLVMSRHARPPTPLAANGRMFVFGEYHVSAVDAYNGTILWRRRVNPQSVSHQGQPFADNDYLYLRQGSMTARYDADTGKVAGVHNSNSGPVVHDATKPKLFATDVRNGKSGAIEVDGSGKQLTITLTTRSADRAVDDAWELALDFRSPHHRLEAPGRGALELIVEPWSATFRNHPTFDHPKIDLQRVSDDGEVSVVRLSIQWSKIEELVGWHPTSFAMAADLKLWGDDFRLGLWARPLATETFFFNNAEAIMVVAPEALSLKADPTELSPWLPVRVMAELPAHVRNSGRLPLLMRVDGNEDLRDATGNPWHSTHRARGFELIKRQSPFTLMTGWRDYSRSYGCSGFSCSATTDFFRSGTIGVYDRQDDSGMRSISGIRSGCGLTLVPALGMLLYSESAADCTCGYSFATSLAMAPVRQRRNEDWALFHQKHLEPGQIRQSALNFGAPGDRRDQDGILWLGYPRPALALAGRLTMDLPYRIDLFADLGPHRVNSDRIDFEGTERDWIYGSQLRGVSKLSMDLIYYQPDKVLMSLGGGEGPKIDGDLNDNCWNGFGPLPSITGNGAYYFRHDARNLFVAYEDVAVRDRRGQATPWKTAVTQRDGPVDRDDHLRLSLREVGGPRILTFGVSAAGGMYDSMLSFATDIPPLGDIEIDGNVEEWKQEAKERGALVKLPGNAQLRAGWNKKGLLLLLRLPKGFDGGSGSTAGAIAILVGHGDSTTVHQLTVHAIEGKCHVRSWDGEKNIDASINAVGDSADGMTVEAIVPWANLGTSSEPGTTLNMAIRYFDPRESYFTERRMAPFDSARERAGEFRRNRGLTLRLSSAAGDVIIETEARRNHYGYLAYDLVMKAADRPVWNGDWTSKVSTNEDAFRAELAIPWKTLEEAGLQRERLQLDLNKPINAVHAQDRMLPLLDRQSVIVHTAEQPETADYVVRLHFAELDDVVAGQRVFDVVLQGRVVLENLDVVHEAGGRYRAIVKEFSNIRAGRSIELQLVPKAGKLDATTTPILNGLEIYQVPAE